MRGNELNYSLSVESSLGQINPDYSFSSIDDYLYLIHKLI